MSEFVERELASALRRAAVGAKSPEILYHYTTSPGLLGILSSRSLHATNIWYLNDQAEFAHALDITLGLLDATDPSTQNRFEQGLQRVLERATRLLSNTPVFVGSFSAQGDHLSQWRGYCHSGAGFAVGIKRTALKQIAAKEDRFVLANCVYDPQKQIDILSAIIGATIAYADELWTPDPDNSQSVYRQIYQEFSAVLAVISPLLKHSSFSDEHEWRLISRRRAIDRSEWQFRMGHSMIIPFTAISLARAKRKHIIDHLVVGPTPHPELARESAAAIHLDGVAQIERVSSSAIPFRDW